MEAEADDPTSENVPQPGKKPAAQFTGSGGMSVAVWKKGGPDEPKDYSVTIARAYSDAEGNVRHANDVLDRDLLRLQQLLGMADDWIERDKGRLRTPSKGPARGNSSPQR